MRRTQARICLYRALRRPIGPISIRTQPRSLLHTPKFCVLCPVRRGCAIAASVQEQFSGGPQYSSRAMVAYIMGLATSQASVLRNPSPALHTTYYHPKYA